MDAAICFPQGRVHTGDRAKTLQSAAPMQMPDTLFLDQLTDMDMARLPRIVLQECSIVRCAAKVLGGKRTGMG